MSSAAGFLLISVCVISVSGYGYGPGPTACGHMTPTDHPGNPQPWSSSPFSVELSTNTYIPGETVTVTLKGSNGQFFEGFLIQPRQADGSSEETYGSFNQPWPDNTKNPCTKTALSHSDDNKRNSITLTWTPPAKSVGDIRFYFTVAKSEETYWVKQESAVLKYGGTEVPTGQPSEPGSINRDPECESTLGCYPATCTTNCNYLVTWKNLGTEVEFTIKRKVSSSNYYVSIGFSSDAKMGGDSAVDCIASQGNVNVKSSFNVEGDYINELLTPDDYGLSSIAGSLQDGTLTCNFRRTKSADVAGNAAKFFDLSTSWYLFVAAGPVTNGVKVQHSTTVISQEKIDFQAITKPLGTTPQPPVGGTINRDTQCESTLGCFPATCTTNCDYLITWKNQATDVEFTIKRRASISDYYVAIGFSSDIKMGGTSVVECIASKGNVNVKSSFNVLVGKSNELLTPDNYGLSSITGSLQDGTLTCNFRRKKSADATGNAGKFYDLSTPWYLFVASGPVDNNGMKTRHTWLTVSPEKLNFQAITKPPGTTPQPQAGGTLAKSTSCGDTHGCFSDCEGGMCGFLLTWVDQGNDVAMSLSCKKAASGYCAIGLSSDKEMGDDSVVSCFSNNGVVSVAASYNAGKSNEALNNDMFGLTLVFSSHKDGVLTCSFLRKKTAALASAGSVRRKRAAAADGSTFFDMNSNWNLFFAEGPQIGGQVTKHDKFPIVSTKKADFQSTEDIGGESGRHDMVKAHGILMSIAWLFCATIGLFMARFYKDTWPEGLEACGQKRWFQGHRTLMMTTFLATVAAFVIIFVHEKEWVDIDGSTFQKSHPIIGTVVMGLALLNPIMAFFRPHPGTKRRPLFKFAHTLVGYGALILGIVNIFSGTLLSSSNLPDYIRYILYGFLGWTFLIDMILYIYSCTKQPKGGRREAYEMREGGHGSYSKEKKGVDQVKICILVLHVIVVLGVAVAVSVVIGVAKGNKP